MVETRARLTQREAIGVCADLKRKGKRSIAAIIACPYVSPRVAEICREHGVGYLDAAGNCDIRASGFVLQIDGRPNAAPDTRPLLNPFATKASRVARLLLIHPGRSWQVQELAEAGQISLGLASKAKDALIEQGHAQERAGRLEARDSRALLETWSAVYKLPARRSQLYVMDETDRTETAVLRWCEKQHIEHGLAEFSGAWRLAPMVRYKQASVCLRESSSRDILSDLMRDLDAKPVETGSNLVVSITSDESIFFDARKVESLTVLSPVQLYLAFHAQRGRGREAADELMQRVLAPGFEQAIQHVGAKDGAR
ncbi:MAG: hypothetical protein HYR84_03555 [Planctomycetes bacterium]|nr:hypothetical protein [Planctomycetota bacterium]